MFKKNQACPVLFVFVHGNLLILFLVISLQTVQITINKKKIIGIYDYDRLKYVKIWGNYHTNAIKARLLF